MSLFARVFGLSNLSVTLLNAVCNAAVANILYAIGSYILGNKRVALAAAFLVSFFPGYILYCSVASNQIVSTTFSWFGIFLFLTAQKKKSLWIALLAGFSLAFATFIRTDNMLIFYAALVTGAVYFVDVFVKALQARKAPEKKKMEWRAPVVSVLLVVVMAAGYFASIAGVQWYTVVKGKYLYPEKEANNAYYQIAVGQNISSDGRSNATFITPYRELDKEEANAFFKQSIKDNLFKPGFAKLHVTKFRMMWADRYTFWTVYRMEPEAQPPLIESYLRSAEVYSFLVSIPLLFSALFFFKRKKSFQFVVFPVALFANFAFFILIVNNPRYRFTIETGILFLAAIGMYELTYLLRKKSPWLVQKLQKFQARGNDTPPEAMEQ